MDFSGYTDIARGAARCLGYELPINFNRPYMATSVGNFWQRWHISMSSFFRDYLYFGLGGSQRGNVYRNLFLTFVAIGLWHGAGWNFVIYGACHAGMICWERWRRERRKQLGLPEVELQGLQLAWRIFLIFNFVSLTRVLFRGGSMDQAWRYLEAMLDGNGAAFPVATVGIFALLLAVALHYTPQSWSYRWKPVFCALPSVAQAGVIVAVTYSVIALSTGSAPFIYFQF